VIVENNRRFVPSFVFWLVAIYVVLTYSTLALDDSVVAALVHEDGYFESIGAAGLLVTSLLFAYCAVRSRRTDAIPQISQMKRLVYVGMALLFFFGAGEEISWGQRILGFSGPSDVITHNVQGEFNVHNLSAVQRKNGFDLNRAFDLFWFAFVVAVPAAAFAAPKLRHLAITTMPVVPWPVGVLFMSAYLLAKIARVLFADTYTLAAVPLGQAVEEVKESNYAVLFVLAGLFAAWELRQIVREASGASGA
jgi:hypothetical protein